MNVINEFDRMKDLVLDVLRKSERARNDDQWLILCVLQRLGENIKAVRLADGSIKVDWHDINVERLSSFETITRCRREIQNVHKMYLPTDESVMARRKLRAVMLAEHFKTIK